jgi:Putative restriction endonuclease
MGHPADDRDRKIPLYARHRVPSAWLIEPLANTLEVYALGQDDRWGAASTFKDAERPCGVGVAASGLSAGRMTCPRRNVGGRPILLFTS